MVDEDRILRLLRSITDDISVLKRESGADESRREDPMWLRGVKYTFVTAIVIGRLNALGDLEDFVSHVAAFVAQP